MSLGAHSKAELERHLGTSRPVQRALQRWTTTGARRRARSVVTPRHSRHPHCCSLASPTSAPHLTILMSHCSPTSAASLLTPTATSLANPSTILMGPTVAPLLAIHTATSPPLSYSSCCLTTPSPAASTAAASPPHRHQIYSCYCFVGSKPVLPRRPSVGAASS